MYTFVLYLAIVNKLLRHCHSWLARQCKGMQYNSFNVYCRELAPGIVCLTGDRAQGDDSKHDSHYRDVLLCLQKWYNNVER